MKITDISISYEATQSLSNYCNVRPGIRLAAILEDGDNRAAIQDQLMDEARSIVHTQIDDALFADGQAPRYYAGQRYRVQYNRDARLIVITPEHEDVQEQLETLGGVWLSHMGVRPMRQARLDQAREVAARLAVYLGDGASLAFTVVDCSDGDLSQLGTMKPAQDAHPQPDQRGYPDGSGLDEEPDEEESFDEYEARMAGETERVKFASAKEVTSVLVPPDIEPDHLYAALEEAGWTWDEASHVWRND